MASSCLILKAPRPQFPIRVSTQDPQQFDQPSQSRTLRWKHVACFSYFPVWVTVPDMRVIIEVVKRHIGSCGFNTADIKIEFFREGVYNKLYTVKTSDLRTGLPVQLLFCISLPVDPWYKTESEVATTEFVRRNTKIPVPVIFAYDSSPNNELGLEWILMEKIAGTALQVVWSDMDEPHQDNIVNQVADWVDQLSRLPFDRAGSLYMQYTETELMFYIGAMVEPSFFVGRRRGYSIDRGPFFSLRAFYDAVLDAQQQEINDPAYLDDYRRLLRAAEREILKNSGNGKASGGSEEEQRIRRANGSYQHDNDSGYGAGSGGSEEEEMTQMANGSSDKNMRTGSDDDVSDILCGNLALFSASDLSAIPQAIEALRYNLSDLVREPKSNMLMHPDISLDNLLVDASGSYIALVDWESTIISPPSLHPRVPYFLDSETVHEPVGEADQVSYGDDAVNASQEALRLTVLRKAFEERLVEIDSKYKEILEPRVGLEKALQERIFGRWEHQARVPGWVDVQLAPTDENDEDEERDDWQSLGWSGSEDMD